MKTLIFALFFSVSASASFENIDKACNGLYQHLKFESTEGGFTKAFSGTNSKGEACQVKVMSNYAHSCAIFIAPEGARMEAVYLHYSSKFRELKIVEGTLAITAHNDRFDTGPITNIPTGRHREILTIESDANQIKVQFEKKSGFRLNRTDSVHDCTAVIE